MFELPVRWKAAASVPASWRQKVSKVTKHYKSEGNIYYIYIYNILHVYLQLCPKPVLNIAQSRFVKYLWQPCQDSE